MAANIPRRLGLRKSTRPKVDWSHPINRGLVSCWPIVPNAAGAPQIQDIAGQRHFTVSSGGISDTKFGGTTIKFNGSTQFASTPAAKDKFANLGALTISLWVMHLAAQSGRMLNYGGSTAVGGFTCTCNSTHDISFVHGFSGGLMARSTSNNTFTQNVWHHVVITWPGGLTAANVHTYIDTVEPSYRITTDGIGTQPDDSATQLFMGAASAVPGNPLNAAMENVRIFNRVLSASEIKRLFQEPWAGITDRSEGTLYRVGATGGGSRTLAVATTEANDTFAATMQLLDRVNVALTEAGDTFAANLTHGHFVNVALQEAGDIAVAALQVRANISAAVQEAGDTAAVSLKVRANIAAALQEQGDTFAATIHLVQRVNVVLQEQGDTFFANILSGSGPAAPTGGIIPVYARRKARR